MAGVRVKLKEVGATRPAVVDDAAELPAVVGGSQMWRAPVVSEGGEDGSDRDENDLVCSSCGVARWGPTFTALIAGPNSRTSRRRNAMPTPR
jgi:hypothetical protein